MSDASPQKLRVSSALRAGKIASVRRPESAGTHKIPKTQITRVGRRSRGGARDLPCPLAPVARSFEFELGLEGFLWLHPLSRCVTWRRVCFSPAEGDRSGPDRPHLPGAGKKEVGQVRSG